MVQQSIDGFSQDCDIYMPLVDYLVDCLTLRGGKNLGMRLDHMGMPCSTLQSAGNDRRGSKYQAYKVDHVGLVGKVLF